MSRFDDLIQAMTTANMKHKKQFLLYLLQTIRQTKQPLPSADKSALLNYAYSEVDVFLDTIDNATSYKEKDEIFECEDLLLGVIMHLCPPNEVPQSNRERIKLLVEIVKKERYIENTIDRIFAQDSIEESEIQQLLATVRQTDDEYHKGVLYSGLIHHKDKIGNFTNDARCGIAEYLVAEFERYLAQEQLSDDSINNLELAADACVEFANDPVVSVLQKILALGYNNVNYYAVKSLISVGEDAPAAIIFSLAQDLEYAHLTHSLLAQYGKQALFPKEYATPEYLAKSDMVHWLVYPTELGKKPDEIVYIGKIKPLFKKEEYYVFKYRSDSDTLDDESKNKWLIGWSSEEGGTFSNFDSYAPFEKIPTKKALRLIKKKIIG